MRFINFVEGYTEEKVIPTFLKRWLDPQLREPVGIKTIRFEGWSAFRREIAAKARHHLLGPGHEKLIGCVGLLDLYGPTFYPKHLTTADSRVEWAINMIETEVNAPKFRMFFAVHELEAWLLSQSTLFPAPVQKALPGNTRHPEQVNSDEPPAKLLERLYREKLKETYRKTTHGTDLFGKLDPTVAYERCPRLKRMLDDLLIMARQAGL